MPRPEAPRIALAPDGAPPWMAEAISDGGGHIVPLADAEGIVWGDPRSPDALAAALERAPEARWVQLPFAGIENFVHLVDHEREWTCGKGVYADPVAELALTLALCGMRGVATYARAQSWSAPQGRNLLGARVTILGGGGITESLVRLLAPFQCHITVVRRTATHLDGVDDVLEADRYADALPGADLVVLALALTPETDGIVAAGELSLMEEHAWLVNVARGRHIVTDDLVDALRERRIGGAGLDVTDPEPLPPGHPLWTMTNCLVTPHIGNTPEMAVPLLAERITANVRRFAADEELLGPIDADAGY
ncbi:MAG: D-isomer specific 2-hydroxyacid dehydrogenase family protein [Ilumatobacteraceae bacterium]